jgi:RNA-directed DNA polymerase
MRSHELQAALGRTRSRWHGINWAAGYRRIRSLQRRIVQAVQAGAGRKVKRVTENTGKKTPGIDGAVGNTPDQKAQAIERIGHWQG